MEPITLLLVGEPGLRRGLRMRLEVEPGFAVVGEAADPDALARLAGALNPDVIVLDTDLPSGAGIALDLVRSLSRSHRLVALSLEDGVGAGAAMLEAGATTFVRKHDRGERLIAAIHAAAAGRGPGAEMTR
jgi:DNA-binding NarL/FixJ family response regulator